MKVIFLEDQPLPGTNNNKIQRYKKTEIMIEVTCMYGMFASKQGAPARGADWVDIVVVEDETVPGQRVDVWGWDLV